MTRWIRITLVTAIGALPLALTVPSQAQETCPPLDVTCVIEGVTGSPGDTVGDPTDTVTDTTDPVVTPILDQVDDVLNGKGPVDPPVIPPGGGGGGVREPGGSGSRPPAGGPDRDPTAGGPAGGPTRVNTLPRAATTTVDPLSGTTRPPADPDASTFRGRIGEVIAGAAQSLLVVLALFGIAVAFVVVQERLDRNDPKLALAPVQPEIAAFE